MLQWATAQLKSSYPAKAGYPVRRSFSAPSQALWNTGSSAYYSATDPNSLARSGFFENDHLRNFDLDNQAEAKFATGPLAHTALFGVDYQTGTYDNTSGGTPAGFTVHAL
jgi:iron complex outermembrane receptor protein